MLKDIYIVFTDELYRIFHDKGVITIFFVAVLAYPILYPCIYFNESINDIPIAIIDQSCSQSSRDYIRALDATREVACAYQANSISEAKQLYEKHLIHGIVLIPNDFDRNIQTAGAQATISVYCDMSSFLYYKNLLQASNFVMLHYHHSIQTHRYELLGNDHQMAQILAQPLKYETVMLYNPQGGYPSFLLPAILILILFQTMFFGICMLAGIAREENGELYYLARPSKRNSSRQVLRRSTLRLIIGRALAYFVLYLGLSVYALGLIPRLFGLPHIGSFTDIMLFIIPFLLSTAFFSMTISVFIRERETAMVTLLFSSVVLLFLSGVSWPSSNLPEFWRMIASIFPSTHAINGYIHINSCGATLYETRHEYYILWLQAAAYFLTATLSYFFFGLYYQNTMAQKLRNKIKGKLLNQQSNGNNDTASDSN